MTSELVVRPAHRAECRFAPYASDAFYRVHFTSSSGLVHTRYCTDRAQVKQLISLLEDAVRELHVERDGLCLDGDHIGDARTPDVVDAEFWLGLPVREGMAELGLTSEAEYRRAYKQIEAAVYRRDNRASQTGIRASMVIKKRGAKVTDVA